MKGITEECDNCEEFKDELMITFRFDAVDVSIDQNSLLVFKI